MRCVKQCTEDKSQWHLISFVTKSKHQQHMSYKHQAINVFMKRMKLPIRATHVQIDERIGLPSHVYVVSTGELQSTFCIFEHQIQLIYDLYSKIKFICKLIIKSSTYFICISYSIFSISWNLTCKPHVDNIFYKQLI